MCTSPWFGSVNTWVRFESQRSGVISESSCYPLWHVRPKKIPYEPIALERFGLKNQSLRWGFLLYWKHLKGAIIHSLTCQWAGPVIDERRFGVSVRQYQSRNWDKTRCSNIRIAISSKNSSNSVGSVHLDHLLHHANYREHNCSSEFHPKNCSSFMIVLWQNSYLRGYLTIALFYRSDINFYLQVLISDRVFISMLVTNLENRLNSWQVPDVCDAFKFVAITNMDILPIVTIIKSSSSLSDSYRLW